MYRIPVLIINLLSASLYLEPSGDPSVHDYPGNGASCPQAYGATCFLEECLPFEALQVWVVTTPIWTGIATRILPSHTDLLMM